MNTLPAKCPLCGGEILVTRIHCRECEATIESRFTTTSFAQLSQEQLDFVETFVRCEGKITRMEVELNLSYPTIRNRLQEVIRALGYEPGGGDDGSGLSDADRQSILDDLDKGRITAEAAMRLLQERGG